MNGNKIILYTLLILVGSLFLESCASSKGCGCGTDLNRAIKHQKDIIEDMWSGRDKIWSRYNKEVMAADAVTAGFLIRYVHNMRIKRAYVSAIEVIDLQRYKIYKDNRSVKRCLNERLKTPFIFVHNKN